MRRWAPPGASRATEGSIAHGDQDGAGLWDDLEALLDPESFVPLLAEDTEIKTFEMRWGNDYAIVARPDHALHYEVQPWEAALMRRMDGTNSAGALAGASNPSHAVSGGLHSESEQRHRGGSLTGRSVGEFEEYVGVT